MKWPTVALGDIFDVERGGSPRPIDDFITDGEGHNWVMISDATASGKVINSTKKKIRPEGLKKTRKVFPGDFILSNSMSFGRPYIMGIEGCIHDGWLLMRPRDGRVDQDYFYHLLGSPDVYDSFASRAAGATVKNLNSGIVREVKIPLPPLDEQRRIAGILDQADALRRLRARALEKLNTLGQAIFHEMFGDPFSVSRSNQLVALEDLVERITYGFTSPMSHHPEGIPIVTGKNVREGFIDYSTCKFANQVEFDQLTSKSKPEIGDLLITKDGTIGRYSVFSDDFPICINQSVALIKPDLSKVVPEYLSAYVGSAGVQARFQKMKKGNALPHLQITELAKFPIFSPTQQEQNQLKDRLLKVQEQRHILEIGIRYQESLFTSLQHRAFRGEL